SLCGLWPAVGEVAEERNAEDVQGLPARNVRNERRHRERRTALFHSRLKAHWSRHHSASRRPMTRRNGGTDVNMSTAENPAKSGPDELVPSRYALRVGELEVLVISDGIFPLPAATLATNADPAELAAWLKDNFEKPDTYTWPLNVVVVRSGDRTVLIDS